jgi:hypothetical protein
MGLAPFRWLIGLRACGLARHALSALTLTIIMNTSR